MAYLSNEQKAEAQQAVNDATDIAGVEKAMADTAAKKTLRKAKADAYQAIDDMAYLSDEQKEAARRAVKDATDPAGVEKALADAVATNLEEGKSRRSPSDRRHELPER